MALTTRQRNALPRSAFVYTGAKGTPRSKWRYPVPTKAQARRAGISEAQRVKTHAAAKAYSSRRTTKGTPAKVHAVVHKRGPLTPTRKRGRKRR